MGGACSTQRGEEKYLKGFGDETEGKMHLGIFLFRCMM